MSAYVPRREMLRQPQAPEKSSVLAKRRQRIVSLTNHIMEATEMNDMFGTLDVKLRSVGSRTLQILLDSKCP